MENPISANYFFFANLVICVNLVLNYPMEIIFFEKAELGYLNQLVDWEKICFPESSWNRNQVESHILSCPFALAKSHADYLGYCLYSTNPWELEIHKIAVLPQARRKGIAGSMIHALQSRYNMLTFFWR